MVTRRTQEQMCEKMQCAVVQMLKLIFYDLYPQNHESCFNIPPGERYSGLPLPSGHA